MRLQLRSEVNKLGQIVTALNMFSGPIFTFILALMIFMMRKRVFNLRLVSAEITETLIKFARTFEIFNN